MSANALFCPSCGQTLLPHFSECPNCGAAAPSAAERVPASAREALICPQCGRENPPDSLFCNRCGSHIRQACPQCGRENPPDAAYCNRCGMRLTGEPAPARKPRLQRASKPPRAEHFHAGWLPQRPPRRPRAEDYQFAGWMPEKRRK